MRTGTRTKLKTYVSQHFCLFSPRKNEVFQSISSVLTWAIMDANPLHEFFVARIPIKTAIS